MKLTLEMAVERNDAEIELVIKCDYTPETPDVYYLSNGDPGYPGDPEEFEVASARDEHGKLYDLTPEEEDRAMDLARAKHADLCIPDEP